MKRHFAFALALLMTFSLCACAKDTPIEQEPTPVQEQVETPTPEPELQEEPVYDENTLALILESPQWVLSSDGSYYELTNVAFCTNVVCPEYQYMNIYVPAEYIDGGEVCGYTAETAPIVLQNNCSGWNSSTPGSVNASYIENGFVFVNCGARSRNAGENGKSPSPVVDLKSAVRTLRLNADVIPGDEARIISVGASGAGQMSSILGASGNMDEYYSYLYENGAPGILFDEGSGTYTSTINDDIFGCMCYCPIADIENADMAYAWMRYDCGETKYAGKGGGSEFSPFQLELQHDLAIAFCEYINDLELVGLDGEPLSFALNDDGTPNPRSGSFYTQTLQNMSDAFNAFVAANTASDGSFSYKALGSKDSKTFEELLASYGDWEKWLEKNDDGTYSVTDMYGFIQGTSLSRNKDIPGFDTFDLSAENNAFGTTSEDAVHFSASVAAVLEANYDHYSTLEGFDVVAVDSYIEQGLRDDIIEQTYLMNATQILLACANNSEESDFAEHWRTRNGTADQHTSFTIAYNLCLSAAMAGAESVDYSLVWAMAHGSAEGTSTGTFADWVHSICGGISSVDQ